ncbi:MAG: 50S ribosomal protein L25 [Acidobacteriales bacterium]|nr:50S ribosomal protein L25 [Terriglobales bacterium]
MITNELVEAQTRPAESRGKNEAKRLRVTGRIPAVVYGAGKDSIAVSVSPKQITKILHSESGHNTIFDLKVGEGAAEKAMIVDWQYDPVKDNLLHIDFKRIDMKKALRVTVPVILTGTAEGVKTQGGILDQIMREVELECLPADIPSHIDLDVTNLVFGQVLRVSDLAHGGKLKFITAEDQAIAHITAVKEEVVATPEATAEAAAAAPAEPEVIKKGKQETEEVAEAPAGKK